MEAGEAAEEAGAQGTASEATAPAPLHKSRSQQAAAVLDRNLAELATEWQGGGDGMEGTAAGDVEAAEPAAPAKEE